MSPDSYPSSLGHSGTGGNQHTEKSVCEESKFDSTCSVDGSCPREPLRGGCDPMKGGVVIKSQLKFPSTVKVSGT